MYLVKTTDPAQLTGKAAELFAMFPPHVGPPEPLKLMSASPGLLEAQAGVIAYYRDHKDLDFAMLAAIRLLAARHLDAQACIDFNGGLLASAGMSQDELDALPAQPEGGGDFTDQQRALIAFALKVLKAPDAVRAEDLDALRALGWPDAAIYDAAAQAVNMQAPATLMRAFKR